MGKVDEIALKKLSVNVNTYLVENKGYSLENKYSGELYFDDGDVIEVTSFIVRDDPAPTKLSFDVIADWDGQGRWRRNEVVEKHPEGWFFSKYAPSIQVETGEQGILCKLSFRILSIGEDFISVDGNWTEDNTPHRFTGDLELTR